MRTGELVDATAADIRQLCAMHDVDCVIDLRTDAECKRSPEPIPLMHGIEYIHLPAVLTTPFARDPGAGRVRAARQIYKATERPFKAIHDMYTQALLGAAGIEAYSRFLQILLDAHEGATLWHCTQGKDRTGIAAILVEHVLGVPQEYIMSDYLATNLFVGRLVDKLRVALSRRRITRHLDADIWALAYANTYYFATVYKTLDRNFGGIDAYIERTLGFGRDKQEALRELYLEPVLPSAGATGSFRIDAR
jgi:protein-tyrosine phosphatase